jgi:hypothetical protein
VKLTDEVKHQAVEHCKCVGPDATTGHEDQVLTVFSSLGCLQVRAGRHGRYRHPAAAAVHRQAADSDGVPKVRQSVA